jgi:Xaa-Pro aminopeptidase
LLEFEEKLERVAGFLAAENLGGVLLNAQHNFAWLTCGGRNGVDQSRDPGVGTLLVRRDGRRFVLASKIEMARLLAEELNGRDWEPVEFGWAEEKASPAFVADRAQTLLKVGARLGADLPIGGDVRVVEGALTRLRYSLTDAEIERYRALGRDAGVAIGEVAGALKPGLSELEIARRAADALAAYGASAVVALVAADERLSQFRHPVPTVRQWEKVVMIAVCARRGGLTASLSRIVCAGPVPDELLHRTEATVRVNAKLLAATKNGLTGAALYEVAARAYAGEGFHGEEQLHHQGGAIGYRTREWVAHPFNAEQVQPPQAFAWNPSITGTKVEETCIAFNGHCEVITATPDWPAISVEVEGVRYELPGVLAL